MKKRSRNIRNTANVMIIQTENKHGAVNQLEDLFITWNGFQSMAHARPTVTIFWRQSSYWEVGGRGGVFNDVFEILIYGGSWDYVT